MSTERVLIVDDERNIRLTVGRALERLEVEVLEAVTGEEALETLRKERISLVLLDLKMPGIDGMEVLRRLRDGGNDVKVLIITAHGTIDNAVEAMKLGAVD
ncbi:MAG TPA: response regulator, partial [Spirochaetia bacterium]|nr:response regulator [Spirochaetia bacterium]